MGSRRETINVFMGYEPVQKQRWTNTGVGYIDNLGAIVEGSTMGPIELRYQQAKLVVSSKVGSVEGSDMVVG